MTTTIPDPRPVVRQHDEIATVSGFRCSSCAHPVALAAPWCPRCRGTLQPTEFGPGGTVWSATVLRVPLPGRTPPSAMAYVDLDDGPRVLGHVAGSTDRRHHYGARARLVGANEDGDPLFEVSP